MNLYSLRQYTSVPSYMLSLFGFRRLATLAGMGCYVILTLVCISPMASERFIVKAGKEGIASSTCYPKWRQ